MTRVLDSASDDVPATAGAAPVTTPAPQAGVPVTAPVESAGDLGRGGRMHLVDNSRHFLGSNGIVGAGLGLAMGASTA